MCYPNQMLWWMVGSISFCTCAFQKSLFTLDDFLLKSLGIALPLFRDDLPMTFASHSTHASFKNTFEYWLRRGEATRYLGFKIGMDIDCSEHYNLLVDKIKAKLIWWNARKLSLAAKIVIANQVLMATIWHTTACWIIAPKSMKVIKRLIRNFLWPRGKTCSCKGCMDYTHKR